MMLLRALAHKNYRIFIFGQSISLIGMWMQRMAIGWLVYRLTGSEFLLGVIAFCGQIPILFLAPLTGVLADRWNRRTLLLITQIFAMFQALLLAALTYGEWIAIWQIICLSLFLGVVSAFEMTTRQTFVRDMVTNNDDLLSAIALNSFTVNVARMLGPLAAGILIVIGGEGLCFLVNGVSYLGVVASLVVMRVDASATATRGRRVLADLKQGIVYAFRFAPIRSILLLLALVSFLGMPYSMLLPVIAKDVLGGGPTTLSFLMAASASGALVGAVFLASRRGIRGLASTIAITSGVFGVGLVAFSFSSYFWLSCALMFVTGFAWMVQLESSNTVLQTIVPEDKRGRVMSLYTMAFLGMTPIGSLLIGSVAAEFGGPQTLMICGVACVAGSLLFASRLRAIGSQLS